MSKSLLFWVLMLLWLIGLVWPYFGESRPSWSAIAGNGLLFVIVALLGSKVMGPPLKE